MSHYESQFHGSSHLQNCPMDLFFTKAALNNLISRDRGTHPGSPTLPCCSPAPGEGKVSWSTQSSAHSQSRQTLSSVPAGIGHLCSQEGNDIVLYWRSLELIWSNPGAAAPTKAAGNAGAILSTPGLTIVQTSMRTCLRLGPYPLPGH